ncbi:MAG: exonuclease domain-containing protein [Betaproteobacteria bacterium]
MASLFAPRLAFVDVETTGTSPSRERVTEVGVVLVEADGAERRVAEWSSLVNPGVPIPPEIQWLTGITNEMVRAAPRFADIAADLAARLHEAVFVAHNARFDYGFLRAEFARVGIDFRARTLCTVRLSRALYPERGPHSLDAIVARLGLDAAGRHRALGDARMLWQFVQTLYARRTPAEIERAVDAVLARPATPVHLPPQVLDELPRAPGVYLFYGLNAHPIYIGKALDLRARVADHFGAEAVNATDAKLAAEAHRLEWEETAGEFGALLREAELIKTRLPAHNIALRRRRGAVVFALDDGASRPRFATATGMSPEALEGAFGPFASRASARAALIALANEHGLCLKTMGLERRRRDSPAADPCFGRQLHRCAGACVGEESPAAHATRLRELAAHWQLPPWPHAGALALVERNAGCLREDWHVFDRWCWLGTVRNADAAAQLARAAQRLFEADSAKLVMKALAAKAPWALERVALPVA